MPAWDKRVRSLTLHGVEQNMKLGARYFRFEVLESARDPNRLRLRTAVRVLEEEGVAKFDADPRDHAGRLACLHFGGGVVGQIALLERCQRYASGPTTEGRRAVEGLVPAWLLGRANDPSPRALAVRSRVAP